MTTNRITDYVTPTPAEAELAKVSSRKLALLLGRKGALSLHVRAGKKEESIEIPVAAYRLLADMLTEMAKGNAVTLIPIHAELTTQQAADFLNVSRPFLVERLEQGDIPFHKIGTHRRVRFQDLLRYKQQIDQKRLEALDALSAADQELGLGYQQ